MNEPPDSTPSPEPFTPKTYRSISEVAELLSVKPHVLRYWETQFPMLHPKKGKSGSRMYRQRDVELLGRIRALLYEKGFTIRGARQRIRQEQRERGGEGQLGLGIENPVATGLAEIREELEAIRNALRPTKQRSRPI
ncbi:MAG: MerR family transcriptional regulator [Candidatus Eisenbacteria bacterium]|nr:MerR family transcriptional regulator [Candidatus Eisenbacteria bacterium]